MSYPLNVTILSNATIMNATNMVCGCIEKNAASYWGNVVMKGGFYLSAISDLLIYGAFFFGLTAGILLLSLCDFLYRQYFKEKVNK